ncbi:MAG: hypothetical protein ACMXYG_07485 [Candidatus Woesearchaeota archaeon]
MILPKIKKKIDNFLMDEQGSISKSNLIKGALFLTSSGAFLQKTKAQMPEPGQIYTDNRGNQRIVSREQCMHTISAASGEGVYFARGQEEIGTCCNAEGQKLPGTPAMRWECARYHCTWICTTGDGSLDCDRTRRGSEPDRFPQNGGGCENSRHNRHKNCGTVEITAMRSLEFIKSFTFFHDRSTKSLKATSYYKGYDVYFSEMNECPGTLGHKNECYHSNCRWYQTCNWWPF